MLVPVVAALAEGRQLVQWGARPPPPHCGCARHPLSRLVDTVPFAAAPPVRAWHFGIVGTDVASDSLLASCSDSQIYIYLLAGVVAAAAAGDRGGGVRTPS